MILLMIILELRKFLQNISRGAVGSDLNNIPPDILPTSLLPVRFHQNCLAAGSTIELT